MIVGPLRRLGAERVERMDAGEGSPEEIAEAYRLLDTVNRKLGGHRLTERALLPLVATVTGPLESVSAETDRLEILDVAGGDGAFAVRLREQALRAGRDARVTVVDLNSEALSAMPPGVAAVRGDAFALPLADRAVDLAHSSCFFHHLSTAGARDVLAEMCRVSRRAVIVNDLVRSRVAAVSIWALTRALVSNRLVRADGPLSVRKSFLPDELLGIAQAVGLSAQPSYRWSIRRGFPYRMALVGVRLRETGEDAAGRAEQR
ncbi:MAG TPA: methyltransferase domain-containing protein [Gemmatimonadota bacterium]|nr:methyltransferase domain-containing protein [Gemmatimonadota bacterium]